MAVTDDTSNRNSKSPVQGGVEPQCSKQVDTGTQTRSKHDARGNFGTIKRHKLRQSDTKEKDSESLSDIDDAQIIGYFNNKLEMQYKKILWEALNRQHTDATKQKRTMEAKKRVSVKKAKTGEKVEVQKRSSKINYDALKALDEEFGEDSEAVAPNIGADSSSYQAGDEHDIGYRGDYTDDGNSEEYGGGNFDDIF